MLPTLTNLFVIAIAAVAAPVVSDFIPGIRVSPVVLEIVLGILIGPEVLGLARPDIVISIFSEFGLAFLFFMAGFEVDLERIRGRPLGLAGLTWLLSLGIALALGAALISGGLQTSIFFVALAMATTTLGTLIPILRDAGTLETSLGLFALAAGTVGEFAPIVAMALLLDETRHIVLSALAINVFGVGVLLAIVLGRRWHPRRLIRLVKQTMHSSAQLAIRLSLLLLISLIVLATRVGLDMLLGAFAAGMVVKQVVEASGSTESEESEGIQKTHYVETLRSKYEAIGFGFVIPVFFITVGMEFDLTGLLGSVTSLLLVPLFLALFFLVRGLPTLLLYRSDLGQRNARSLAWLCATELPLVIAITELGVAAGKMSPIVAAGMVGAGMLSVFLFPLLALARPPAVSTTLPSNLPPDPQNALEGTA